MLFVLPRQLKKACERPPSAQEARPAGHGLYRLWLTERGWQEWTAEGFDGLGEIVGGDFRELLLDEDEGTEVEALDLSAALHVVAHDRSAESVDEGLGVGGVVG